MSQAPPSCLQVMVFMGLGFRVIACGGSIGFCDRLYSTVNDSGSLAGTGLRPVTNAVSTAVIVGLRPAADGSLPIPYVMNYRGCVGGPTLHCWASRQWHNV